MTESNFADRLAEAVIAKRSILCVGLDPQLRYMPPNLARIFAENYGRTTRGITQLFARFNRAIIDAVEPYAVLIKPQIGFSEIYGHDGLEALEDTIGYASEKGLLVDTDAKRCDGGDTADAYADGHIGEVPFWGLGDDPLEITRKRSPIRVDAMTVVAHIGDDCVNRFVARVKQYGTGIFVVGKTSFNPDSRVEQIDTAHGTKVWQDIADMVSEWGVGTQGTKYGYRSVGVVLGTTKAKDDAPEMRRRLPNSWFLGPGLGRQGGAADDAVLAVNPDGLGYVVNNSRGILYAYQKEVPMPSEQFAEAAAIAARNSRDELNEALKRAGKWRF